MSKREKLLVRFRQNPRNVRFEEVDNLLVAWGFSKRTKGSHSSYTYKEFRITIPFRKPFVLPVYIKQLVELLDEISNSEQEGSDE
jgi:predicted RNA binding protein YcfA (HicA-like mRNA interferase family)